MSNPFTFETEEVTTDLETTPEYDFEFEDETDQFLGSLWSTLTGGGAKIEDRTAYSPKDLRKGMRDLKKVYALVLHQTAFTRGNDPNKYNRVNSHYVITPDGRILQLHPNAALLWSSNGFNNGSVAVEFVGNFPNTKGKCWQAQKFGCHKVTQAQIDAGRALVKHLIKEIGLTHILAHRQSSGTRENDPGPDIWYHVGQWAIENHGLKDGGPGFKVGTGNPIPREWRDWGRRTKELEYGFHTEEELEAGEPAADELEDESYPDSVLKALRSGLETAGVKLAVAFGYQDENQLSNLVFFTRHPERGGKAISRSEPNFQQLSREWIQIRDSIVRPALRAAAAPASGSTPAPAGPTAPVTGTPDIVNVRGIRVARQIATQVGNLLVAAEADGVKLGGGGYRSSASQIELRKKHCGTTHFDIYEKPSSQCVPPTARPGGSMHEKGLAIDFTYNGSTIKSRENPGFQWLARNAGKFGLKNLPSEPWHWSINGR